MQHPLETRPPRRTVIWDEAAARYVWLDPRERDAAHAIRARRNTFQTATPAGLYNSGLADLWNPDEYDAATRQAARVREYVKRPEVVARRRAKSRGTPAALFAEGFDPIPLSDVVPIMADILAALVAPPSLVEALDGMGCNPFADILA